MEGLNKREAIGNIEKALIRDIRNIFEPLGIRILLTGSRTRGLVTKDSDFDLFAIKKVPDGLDHDELLELFNQHITEVNQVVFNNFPDANVPEGKRWLVFIRNGKEFSIIPKLQLGDNYREDIFFSPDGEKMVKNNPIQSILDSKRKEKETSNRFRETVLFLKEYIADNFNLKSGVSYILESLLAEVDNEIYLDNSDIRERILKILDFLIPEIQNNPDRFLRLGSSDRKVFANNEMKDRVLLILKRLKEDFSN